MNADFALLRQELRGLDGDLYLCHLFAPAASRDALLTLYHLYADSARVPSLVSDPMIGAIRLQWWRELLDKETHDTPIGHALMMHPLEREKALALIDGREAALSETPRHVHELEDEARSVGTAFLQLACDIIGAEADADLLQSAGTGFELLRLVPQDGTDVAARAYELLAAACAQFNRLPRAQRKALLPAFLPIGLAKRHAAHFPHPKTLLRYQLSLLRMAALGRL